MHEKLLLANRYVQDFKTAWERVGQVEAEQGFLHIPQGGVAARPAGQHERRYNLAEGLKEVQVLIPDREGDKPPDRDIVLKPRGRGDDAIQYVCETHRSYDPLHYTLFFPEGSEDGWNLDMRLEAPMGGTTRDDDEVDEDDTVSQRYRDYYRGIEELHERGGRLGRLTARDFAAFHLHSRADERDTLLRGRRAFQEYLCMSYAKVKTVPLRPPFCACRLVPVRGFRLTSDPYTRRWRVKNCITLRRIKRNSVRSNTTNFRSGLTMPRRVAGLGGG